MTSLPRGALTAEEAERIRKRDSLPTIPAKYDVVLRVAGEARTIRFMREFGGRSTRFPEKPKPDSRLVLILGRRAVELLRREFGAVEVRWPAGSEYLACVDARRLRQKKGLSIPDIARRLYRDTSTIERYVRGVVPELVPVAPEPAAKAPTSLETLPLFAWLAERRRARERT